MSLFLDLLRQPWFLIPFSVVFIYGVAFALTGLMHLLVLVDAEVRIWFYYKFRHPRKKP